MTRYRRRGLTAACLAAGLACLGCQSAQKKPAGGGERFWDAPPERRPPQADPVSANAPGGGVLAGQVLDQYGKHPRDVSIDVVPLGGTGKVVKDAASDRDGCFYIAGLKPGQTYELVARVRDGDRVLVGRVQARPPDPILLIRLREDLASPSTPPPAPAPVPPAGGGPAMQPEGPKQSVPPAPDPNWGDPLLDGGEPRAKRTSDNAWSPAPPAPQYNPPSRPNPAPVPVRPESVGNSDRPPVRPGVPLTVPGPRKPPEVSVPFAPTSNSAPATGFGLAPPAATYCRFDGRRLDDFALYDLDGQLWHFRDHKGKLVLLDFWGTWCQPCLKAIPYLKDLQNRYGPDLEVVGVAVERAAIERRVANVRKMAEITRINYRLLMAGDEGRDPVLRDFRVQKYPTLVLLDDRGEVLWYGDSQGFDKLEATIRRKLGAR